MAGRKSPGDPELTLRSAAPVRYLGHLGLRPHGSFEFRRRSYFSHGLKQISQTLLVARTPLHLRRYHRH
jgi:hypothetical protein